MNIDQEKMMEFKKEFTRFRMAYKFALDEITTKLNILNEEFKYVHEYNPIEHISTRLKSPESIMKKMLKKNIGFSFQAIEENIKDIAGIRITCSFISDIYTISEMIESQRDIEIIEKKDYIENPKSKGYRSLHLILKIPVFMSDREKSVYVEMQIRTISMDFWASLEHKIYYKYNQEIPKELTEELKEAARMASDLDKKMEVLHKKVNIIKEKDDNNIGEFLELFKGAKPQLSASVSEMLFKTENS